MLVNEQNIEGGGRKGLHVTWSGEKIMWLLALAAGPGACRAVRNESGLGIRTNEFAYRPSVNSLNPHAGRCREAPLLKVVLSSRQGQNYAIMPGASFMVDLPFSPNIIFSRIGHGHR